MNGEPQPADVGDDLDRALHGLKIVWFGLFAGALVITVTLVAILTSGGGPAIDLGELRYLFLAAVPVGLVGAYLIAPRLAARDPATIVSGGRGKPGGAGAMFDGWDRAKPDDAFYWFPAYATAFFLRAGMLEGMAILGAMGFFITGDWVLLAGPAVLIAALVAELPTRGAVESFAYAARQKMQGGG
jgi:hypothetical protein